MSGRVEQYVYLAENAGEEIADQFLVDAEAGFSGLTEHPETDAPLSLRRPELAGLRKWQVKGSEKFLIFYLPRRDAVSIVRVFACGAGLVGSVLGMDA